MGIKNRQRRAAKKQRDARRDSRRATRDGAGTRGSADVPSEHDLAHELIDAALIEIRVDPAAASTCARLLLASDAAVSVGALADALRCSLSSTISSVVRRGWLPTDMAEWLSRHGDIAQVPVLAGLLEAEAASHPASRVAARWRADLASLGRAAPIDIARVRGLATALRLHALLAVLPQIETLVPPPGAAVGEVASDVGIDSKVLARVRALLAKAESTEFPEEAETLSAKAQELISRYALDRLLTHDPHSASATAIASARFWIDAPYVMAKAMLVGAVARANRCRTVVNDKLGFATIVGTADDIEAVELLATSLLVQSSAALARHGSHVDNRGRSRTRSFRQSFLVSYAIRIGERLDTVSEATVAASGSGGQLVPLLRRHAERVDEAMTQLFPRTISRGATINNEFGWAAGRAAADQAHLDMRGEVTEQAG